MVVAGIMEACGEEVIGQLACLGEAIDALADFKVDPSMMYKVPEVVL